LANTSNLQLYRDRADNARRAAEAATLSHVRDRCRRPEAAWTQLAERAAATERRRLQLLMMKADTPPT
jgi:hypothetical protein